jgi:hypothetical protein
MQGYIRFYMNNTMTKEIYFTRKSELHRILDKWHKDIANLIDKGNVFYYIIRPDSYDTKPKT